MNYAARRPRSEQRARFSIEDRVVMSEDDLDAIDREFASVRDTLAGTNRILIGLLVSMALASFVLAINLVTGAI